MQLDDIRLDLFVPLEPVPADHALLGVVREPSRGPQAVWLLYRDASGEEYSVAGQMAEGIAEGSES